MTDEPAPRGVTSGRGLVQVNRGCCYFLPWFFTASIAEAAASGSR
jgi:hypothetical protein